jgi:hypothetical protein
MENVKTTLATYTPNQCTEISGTSFTAIKIGYPLLRSNPSVLKKVKSLAAYNQRPTLVRHWLKQRSIF